MERLFNFLKYIIERDIEKLQILTLSSRSLTVINKVSQVVRS